MSNALLQGALMQEQGTRLRLAVLHEVSKVKVRTLAVGEERLALLSLDDRYQESVELHETE